jgi:tetratricopeptide (TPR) repeat protein
MSDMLPLRDRYFTLIGQIVQATLKGEIRSKEQVYQFLLSGIESGTGEIFERCLQEQHSTLEQQVQTETDALKQAKATRSLRAMQTIAAEWNRWQAENQSHAAIALAVRRILDVAPENRLAAFLQTIDPNRADSLDSTQLQLLALMLRRQVAAAQPELQQELRQMADGIQRGFDAWGPLQDNLVSWLYESGQELGFAGVAQRQHEPWSVWIKHLTNPLLIELFRRLTLEQSVSELIASLPRLEVSEWVEMAIVLQLLQQNLIVWFERQAYSTKLSSKVSISTFLAFSILWSNLAQGFEQATAIAAFDRRRFADCSFQIAIQTLRDFSQRSYFPLYGSVFASLPGSRLHSVVSYLNEPLKRVEGTQSKARILTLVGSLTQAQGLLDEANEFYRIARDMAAEAGDRPCEVAALNHISRTHAAQTHYAEAIDYSQRALILSRQIGDRSGEANALVNLGYGEILQAQQREQPDPETYETAIRYVQQGLRLAEQLNDHQSQAVGYNSLGLGYLVLNQPNEAVTHLIAGLKAAQVAGDLYLQGLDLTYLAEAYYALQAPAKTVYAACLGMYYLERIGSRQWRQAAGLLLILKGQLGEQFLLSLQQQRNELIAAIGVDGYDYIPQLIEQYRLEPNER